LLPELAQAKMPKCQLYFKDCTLDLLEESAKPFAQKSHCLFSSTKTTEGFLGLLFSMTAQTGQSLNWNPMLLSSELSTNLIDVAFITA